MDEEAVKESLVFTTEIKVTKAKKEWNNQDNILEDSIENPDEKYMEQSKVMKKLESKMNNQKFGR